MWLYNHVFYPIKKLLSGASVTENVHQFWEDLGRREGREPQVNFAAYSADMAQRHYEIVAPLLPTSKITLVDLGCGSANGLRFFAELLGERLAHGIGVDGSTTIIQKNEIQHPEFQFVHYDLFATSTPLPELINGKADLIICNAMLQSIPQALLPSVMRAIHGMLKPHGVVLVSWWAPYYIDETWVIPFGANTHRHNETLVKKAMSQYLTIVYPLEGATRVDAVSSEGSHRLGQAILRRCLFFCHPRQRGIVVGIKD